MKILRCLTVFLLGSLSISLYAEDYAAQNAALQQEVFALQEELSAAKATIAAQKEKLRRIKMLADDKEVAQKTAQTAAAQALAEKAAKAKAERETAAAKAKADKEAAAKPKTEAEKKAAMAALQAELEADAKGKESAEAVAALKDFGVNTLGARMKKFWRLPPNIPGGLSTKIFVKLDRNGNVVKASIKQSSGYKKFDDAALRAVHDAAPLPMPKHPGAVDALVSDGIITTFHP